MEMAIWGSGSTAGGGLCHPEVKNLRSSFIRFHLNISYNVMYIVFTVHIVVLIFYRILPPRTFMYSTHHLIFLLFILLHYHYAHL
jgi:hypothetical protein